MSSNSNADFARYSFGGFVDVHALLVIKQHFHQQQSISVFVN